MPSSGTHNKTLGSHFGPTYTMGLCVCVHKTYFIAGRFGQIWTGWPREQANFPRSLSCASRSAGGTEWLGNWNAKENCTAIALIASRVMKTERQRKFGHRQLLSIPIRNFSSPCTDARMDDFPINRFLTSKKRMHLNGILYNLYMYININITYFVYIYVYTRSRSADSTSWREISSIFLVEKLLLCHSPHPGPVLTLSCPFSSSSSPTRGSD